MRGFNKLFNSLPVLMMGLSLAPGGAKAASYELACVDVDNTSTQAANGQLAYTDSIFSCANGATAQEGDAGDPGENALLASGGIAQVNPLISPVTWAANAPDAKLPQATPVSFADTRASTSLPPTSFDDTFFEPTNYIGAVDPANPAPWWKGWTLAEGEGSLQTTPFNPLAAEILNGTITPAPTPTPICPVGTAAPTRANIFGAAFPVCVISAPITANVTLTNDHVYLLEGTINVGNGNPQGATALAVSHITLTIEPGTQIFGDTTADDVALAITRGSKIMAQGTAAMPIVMSSADNGNPSTPANNYSGYNEWGGVILDGFAPVNAGPEVVSEAAPDGVTRYFGGAVPTDNSGLMSYVVVTESGEEFRPDEEVQGITLEGVGSGTSLDYVQVHQSGDDGIEAFGGLVNIKHAVITGANDDSLDLDLGYQGGVQFFIGRQTAVHGNNSIESDNNGDNFNALPRSMPTIANVTMLGNSGNADEDTSGALHREGFGGFLHKVIYSDDLNAPASPPPPPPAAP